MNYLDYYANHTVVQPILTEIGFVRRHRERRRLELLTRYLLAPDVNHVLDVGCGSGGLSRMLSRAKMRVTACDVGLDVLRSAARYANGDGDAPVQFFQGDAYHLPLGDGCVDAVVTSEMLEHLPDPPAALKELVRVVRPGGVVVVSVPYKERVRLHRCIHCHKDTPTNGHLHIFGQEAMIALMNECGVRVCATTTLASPVLEHIRFPGVSAWMPFLLWRAIDSLFCRLTDRATWIVARGIKL